MNEIGWMDQQNPQRRPTQAIATQAQYPQSGAAQIATGGYPASSAADMARLTDSRQHILANTEGRAQQIANDPRQKASMDYLQGVVGGQNVPFSDTVKSSILAQQGQGAASAEAAQMQTLRDSLAASGGSIYDPGYQAAQREAMSQRQGQDLNAQGQLESQAGIANQQAQQRGAMDLASVSNQNNQQQNQMLTQANQYRQNDVAQVPSAPTAPAAANANSPWALVPPSQRGGQSRVNNPLRGMI